ncbi:MAG TPA: 4'-phosphopantetheinyl transferase superfamily protein [Rhodocyclaceae bacterium]
MSIFEPTTLARRDDETEVFAVPAGVRVLAARLDLAAADVAALAARLSPEEVERAQRCRFPRDRRRYVVARAHLRRLLGERLGIPAEAVRLAGGEHGKPCLGGDQAASGWHFNLSRCGELALFALARDRRVGIDLEAVREVRGADHIVEHFFSRRERAAYRTLGAGDKLRGFLNCWTRKEAFVKAVGAGLAYPYDCFDVSLAPGEPAQLLRVGERRGEDTGWRLDAFVPRPGFVAAVVCEMQPSSNSEILP